VIGNDIVDLLLVEPPAYSHADHLSRVCTANEVSAVRASAEPARRLAEIWAAKEAAFKLLAKSDPSLRFVPRRLEIQLGASAQLNGADKVSVSFDRSEVCVSLFVTRRWAHAIAVPDAQHAVRWSVCALDPNGADPAAPARESEMARRLGRQLLAEFGSPEARLEFEGRIPVVRCAGRSGRSIDISLSHHGSFAAAAIAWPATGPVPAQNFDRVSVSASAMEAKCCTCTA
jgi:phosphopantetheinyl transferase (holo-ACP synthase)